MREVCVIGMTEDELRRTFADQLTMRLLLREFERMSIQYPAVVNVTRISKGDVAFRSDIQRLVDGTTILLGVVTATQYESTLGRLMGAALELMVGANIAMLQGTRKFSEMRSKKNADSVDKAVAMVQFYTDVVHRIDNFITETYGDSADPPLSLFSFNQEVTVHGGQRGTT